jgi:hypothetical protein
VCSSDQVTRIRFGGVSVRKPDVRFYSSLFFFLPQYPLAVIGNFSRDWMVAAIWRGSYILVIFVAITYAYRLCRKILISLWLMPGTIVCGAATIAPWPFTILYMFYEGGCVTVISTLVTLLFNFLIVFACFKLIDIFMKKHASA